MLKDTKGCVQVYTGNGKGKTTAAIGLAVRAIGQNLRVEMIQFLKVSKCGEHQALRKLGLIIDSGSYIEQPPWQANAKDVWEAHTKIQWEKAMKLASNEKVDVLILDEILGALNKGFISSSELLELLDVRQTGIELILTGRDAPPDLITRADLVTSMEPIKHYMDQGICARAGIEY